MTSVENIREQGQRIKEILGLKGSPIGVRIIRKGKEDQPLEPCSEEHMRFCQALMRARHGMRTVICRENLECPAAAGAFGFKQLPEPLKTGKGLVGFGITAKEEVGVKMFEGMTVFDEGYIDRIEVFPLEEARKEPDVVVVEDEVERLMWIVLASMHSHGGERVRGSTAVLQATCVDATIIPYKEKRLNFNFGCYGCRDATDIGPGEAIIGFPIDDLPAIVTHLEYLNKKALPHSRGKHALSMFMKQQKGGEEGSCSSL
ncbi:MAG: hypothetical protein A4E42_01185 [Methanoregulaceae archaeon PtaU1.Bin222]|nr:MAG: hypothetical protein A4E42_01185 [Methanoregulaceae archaeon PtaU1.Bin222]